ncbi:MAG TPA: hypothetical protein VK361_01490 [Rubrobacteraceae bacterium]|nr:hypothetical protein [Rubrobacteraceae bacterium]
MICADYTRCYACGGRIREFADDVVLARRDGSELRFFHVACSPAAEHTYFIEGACVWSIGYRPAFADDEDIREGTA